MAKKTSKHVLGVMVTGRAIHAALVETGPDGTKVIRHFDRQRTSRFSGGGTTPTVPDLKSADEDTDFSVQFTDTSAMAENMFLGSEFGGFEKGAFGGTENQTDEQKELAATFVLELGDILAECRDAGYPSPLVVFSAASSEVNQVEMRLARTKKKAAGRSELLDLLRQQHNGDFEEECVAFLTMTPADDGVARHLALFPKAVDPVASTLRTMREQQGRMMPTVRLFDTEVSLYLGLARATHDLARPAKQTDDAPPHEGPRNTLIVRAGAEDTLVLFLQDDVLRQSENLRSLTAYEAPETICSRVLLLQDEYGIGEVQHVLLLSEEREDDLIESFEMFFPDARVESLRQYVPDMLEASKGAVPPGALLPAVSVALRLSDDDRYRSVFEEVNLLPKQLLRRRINIPVTWHVLALYVMLFCTVLFFMARYFTMDNKLSGMERNIQQFQVEHGPVEVDAKILQSRIDSLESVHARYMQAINVLEGLLQGSDKWSRALETTSTEVSGVSGIWIESWTPRASGLELAGNAAARDRVVQLADRLGASIASLTFSEIREWPVYSFTLNMPLRNDLPEAARYLRERVAAAEQAAVDQVPVTSTKLDEAQTP